MRLYLYLATNANNYTLALSPTDIRQTVGMARSTYHDQFNVLVDKDYLVSANGNTYEFYEVPQTRREHTSMSADGQLNENDTADGFLFSSDVISVSSKNIEINNNKPTDTAVNSEIYIPKVKEIVNSSPRVQPKGQAFKIKMASYEDNAYYWLKRKGLADKYEHAGIYCIRIDD